MDGREPDLHRPDAPRHRSLAVQLAYRPTQALAAVEATPVAWANLRVGGASTAESDWRIMSWDNASECLRVRAQSDRTRKRT